MATNTKRKGRKKKNKTQVKESPITNSFFSPAVAQLDERQTPTLERGRRFPLPPLTARIHVYRGYYHFSLDERLEDKLVHSW